MGEFYKKNGRVYFRATRCKSATKPQREAIREVNRVRKCFESNTETHHKLQLLTGETHFKQIEGDDEIEAGNDDQRFTRRSERE